MRRKKPQLTVVKTDAEIVARSARPGRSPKLSNGLTMKQDSFARYVADGDDYTAAYRKAFGAGNMKESTLWPNASRLAAESKVRARIDELIQQKSDDELHDARKAKLWGLKLLRQLAETAETEGAKLGAVQTVLRHHGLLTDRIEQVNEDSATTEELRQQLADALATLANPPRLRA